MKKILFAVIVVMICIASCSKKSTPTKDVAVDGEKIFSSNCARCHHSEDPAPGKAPNLAKSKLDKAGLVAVITKGRDHMPAFEDRLSAKEIDGVANYLLSLRK
jgi:cytochrome c6